MVNTYRECFEITNKTAFSISPQRGERIYRHTWDNPPGHLPFAIHYWAQWSIDLSTVDTRYEAVNAGFFSIKWRDSVGAIVVQRMPLWVKTSPKFTQPIWTWSCTNLARDSRNEFPWGLCLRQTNRLRLGYNKIAWGCTQCNRAVDYPEIPMEGSDDARGLESWYDELLGVHRPDDDSLGDDRAEVVLSLSDELGSQP